MNQRTGSRVSPGSPLAFGAEVLPGAPPLKVIWYGTVVVVWAVIGVAVVDGIVDLFVQYWFIQSLGFRTIFWTNLQAATTLFVIGGGVFAAAMGLPLRRYAGSAGLRRAALHLAAWTWIIGGWSAAGYYEEYLLALHGGAFGRADIAFGNDIGFYVFRLPLIWTIVGIAWIASLLGMVTVLFARYDALALNGVLSRDEIGLVARLGLMTNPAFYLLFCAIGLLGAFGTYLTRFQLLFRDNEPSGIRSGAEYLDVVGVFSTVNAIWVTIFVEVGITLLVGYKLYRLYNHYRPIEAAAAADVPRPSFRPLVLVVGGLLAVDAGFFVAVAIRDRVAVIPNEPFIQKPFIEQHMAATVEAYQLADVKVVPWEPPNGALTPESLLASSTVQNAPILPGYSAYIESKSPDLQHAQRYEITKSTMFYAPMLEVYEQQQQLRPYYSFIGVDAVRYRIDGEKKMFVSAVREIPSDRVVGPQDWLKNWGTSTLLYTHGMGLVVSPANEVDASGAPLYTVNGIPPRTSETVFEGEPRVYYGEGGTGTYVLTNIRHLKEFDYATPQFRAEYTLPEGLQAGVRIDSRFKRLVFSLWSLNQAGSDFTAFLFSDFIDLESTRIHLNRSPLERASAVAPFLFLDDASIYAVVAERRLVWMINSLTTTDSYPYSLREQLGDKASDRAPSELQYPTRQINYAEDSAKVTIDAQTGAIAFYKITDGPIVDAWERIYPDLFRSGSSMPESIEAHLTYPLQWFHIQFDDVYKRYHQGNYIEFYNLEDLWDDADEVLGPIGVGLTAFGNSDEATFSVEGNHLLIDPGDLPDSGIESHGGLEFAMVMPFTPEGARNLRSLVVVLQDPGRYGELYSFRIPQGTFVPGPEQADAMIDADPHVNQQLTLWVRHGAQVIAGHTLLLPVGGDVLYVQPIFVKSTQNAIPQLRLVSVVYKGRVTMASSLEEAIRLLEVEGDSDQGRVIVAAGAQK